tara:strand:+ start:56 stop:952 length:897 start_codon:yes stop_codon:yes gene_type:complete
MRIYDCTTFYNENFILDVRFNILDPFVDKFVICESGYSHSGQKKQFNFDINKFSKFKNKIIYLKIDKEPEDLVYFIENREKKETKENARINAIKRIAYQRNFIKEGIIDASKDDLILYSDNDEIPNLKNFELENINNELIYFKQQLFYYKFNLFCDRYEWYGTKGCKKKNLIDFEWLRNTKPKKYKPFRLDTFFSKTKYTNVKIINNGGWHFTQLKNIKDLYEKLTNSEDHQEFKDAKQSIQEIENLMKKKVINYDHKLKKNEYKFAKEFKLQTVSLDNLPEYIKINKDKFKNWIDVN